MRLIDPQIFQLPLAIHSCGYSLWSVEPCWLRPRKQFDWKAPTSSWRGRSAAAAHLRLTAARMHPGCPPVARHRAHQ